jgi:hypothetical protein
MTMSEPKKWRRLLGLLIFITVGFLIRCQKSVKPQMETTVSSPQNIKAEEAEEHAATGFPLQGYHLRLTCESCHGDKEPKPDCRTCHTPPHGPQLKKKCEDCHSPGLAFNRVKFQHPAKSLWAFHQGLGCLECHKEKKFAGTSAACTSCHQDFHKGALGRACITCHRNPAWNVTRFNHSQSGFPLLGAHLALECGDCHRDLQSFRIIPRPSSCASCHLGAYRSSPFPHGAYGAGSECQECHLQDKWEYAHSPFWFNIQTGEHAGLSCDNCHKSQPNYRDYSCHDCHQGHAGDRNGRCLDCHSGGFPDRDLRGTKKS